MAAKEPESELIRAKDLGTFDRWALPSFDEPGSVVVESEEVIAEAAPPPSSSPRRAARSRKSRSKTSSR